MHLATRNELKREIAAVSGGGVTNGDAHDHSGGDGAQIAYSSLSGLPTLGTAAATASTDYATAAHNHSASAINSGTIDPARLGSGSGGASKFLREDSTFQTIAAGGDALVANTLDQFADVTQTAGQTLAITASTTLSGGTHSGTNTGDQTNIPGNAATVTTNANLTGHVTSTGNAAVLGSFTVAQLNTAISDGDVATGGGTATGTNTGDQTSIVGITGSLAEFNTALTGADFASGGGTATGTNTGDQTITLTGGVTGSGTGSFAATVVTNANLTGPVTSSGNATTIVATLDLIPAPTASVGFNGQQATSFRLENRTSDPGSPTTGQIWLRTDV